MARKRMSPEERHDASRRLLNLCGRLLPLGIRIALDVADGTLDQPVPVIERAVRLLEELRELLGAIKRDRADEDDVPDAAEKA